MSKIYRPLLLLLILMPAAVWAQDMNLTQESTARAAQVETAPTIDGEVLQDPAYADAPVITGFTQNQPFEGEAASQRTEIRIVYTLETLYVGVICYDDEPGRIVLGDSRRDGELDEIDSFRMLFDTYNDNLNGFVFGTNPAGMEYDAQVDNNGQGNFARAGQGTGAIGGFNLNWDGAWTVQTSINDDSWTAEFAIPFKTIRFASVEGEQVWGLNFQRNIRRENEQSYWAPLPRQFDLNRVSLAGTLTGMNVIPPRNLKVIPYMLGQSSRDYVNDSEADVTGDVGVDLKYSLTPSLTFDLTYNTDFAQVEVDEQQINLDRFNLFFPEKRPFFLENAGLFTVGAPGEIELFFSRRIGIGEGGRLIPILGGGRLSGRVGNTNIGVLNMQTQSVDDAIAANNYTVARFQHELPNRSAVGVMFNNRSGTGDLALDGDYNRVFAVDGKLGIGENSEVTGFVARSSTPGLDSDQHAFRLHGIMNAQSIRLEGSYSEVADNFNPELGFLLREGYRKVDGLIFTTIRRYRFLGLQEIRPHVSFRSYWNFEGFNETLFTHIDSHWEWQNGYEFHTGMNITGEGVVVPFEIYPGIVVEEGTYNHAEAQLVFYTNQGAPVSYQLRAVIGGFFGGDRVSTTHTLTTRFRDRFTSGIIYQRNDVDLPVGDFSTNLLSARVSYSFTPRLFLQGLYQYNDRADLWSANFRIGWLQAANTGMFLVYNQTNIDSDVAFRSITLKYSRVFDVLR